MEYYVKLIMKGEFPSGEDAEHYRVGSKVYDQIMDIIKVKGVRIY